MSENLYFYRGLEEKLPTSGIKVGGLYHCTDTGNTYRGISSTEYELYSSTVQTNTGDLVKFKSNLDNSNLSVVSHITPIQEGDGDPSLTNIRPFTGHTEVKLWRSGKNLLNISSLFGKSVTKNGGTLTVGTNGGITGSGTPTDYVSAGTVSYPINALPITIPLTLSSSGNGVNICCSVEFIDDNSNIIQRYHFAGGHQPITFTIQDIENYENIIRYRIDIKRSANNVKLSGTSYFQLEIGSTATPYEPYQGEQFTTQLGQTIYGGSLNWTTGQLLKTWQKIVLTGNEPSWSLYSQRTNEYNTFDNTGCFSLNLPDRKLGFNTVYSNQFYNNGTQQAFRAETTSGYLSGHTSVTNIYFSWGENPFVTLDDWKNWLKNQYDSGTPIEIIYELAEPIIVQQLIPQQIKTLPKVNYLYSDCGQTSVQQDFVEPGRFDIITAILDPETNTCSHSRSELDAYVAAGKMVRGNYGGTYTYYENGMFAYDSIEEGMLIQYEVYEDKTFEQYTVAFARQEQIDGLNSHINSLNSRIDSLDEDIGNMGADFINSTADWNQTDSNQYNYIYNKPPLKNGNGQSSMIINEGQANGKHSIAGGTTDKNLISGIVGSDFIASIVTVDPAVANGIASISYGAGTITNAAGTMAIGVNSQAGVKGYYFTAINGNTLTLSTDQNSTVTPTNITWSKRTTIPIIGTILSHGDKITVVNGSIYTECAEIISIDKNAGTITVDNLPFSAIEDVDNTSPNDYFVCVLDKADEGEVECGFGAYAYGYENRATGILSATFGSENKTVGSASFVTGRANVAGGFTSLVGGYQNKVLGSSGFATGQSNTVDGVGSGSIGYNNIISKSQSFAAGANNIIDEACSVALGSSNHITTKFGFAANINNQVRANCATALGHYSITAKQFDDNGNQISGAPGYAQTVLGRYNAYENGEIDNALLVVGNGSDGARSNAFIVRKTGDAEVKNNLYVSGIIQAQQFNLLESLTLSQLSVGPCIKIRNANEYLNFVNTDGVSFMRVFGNSIDSTSMTPESVLTVGPNYSGGFRFETAKTSSGGVGMYVTLGGRKSDDTDAFGLASLSIGAYSKACGVNSAAIGYGAKTNALSQLAIGRWNKLDSDALFIVGNGSYNSTTNTETRSNAFVVDKDGNATVSNDLIVNGDAYVDALNIDGVIQLNDGNINGYANFINDVKINNNLNVTNTISTNNLNSTAASIQNLTLRDDGTIYGYRNYVTLKSGNLNIEGVNGTNYLESTNNLVIGYGNKLLDEKSRHTMIAGCDNLTKGMLNATFGYSNKNVQSNRGYVAGLRLYLDDSENPDGTPRFVFGKYNAKIEPNDIFTIANGTWTDDTDSDVNNENFGTGSNRKNIFQVKSNGEIVIASGAYGPTLPSSGVKGQIFFKKAQ